MTQDSSTVAQVSAGPRNANRFVLSVTAGASAGKSLAISARSPGRLFVGKSTTCDLVLDDRRVSRRHLAIEVSNEGLRITDLDSTNGTLVSGLRVLGAYCRGGEIVGVGDTTLRVDVDHETAEESPDVRMAFGPLVGASLAMRRLYRTCDALAKSLTPVLVEGEAGTGKLALAEALHLASTPDEPFTVVEGARYESEALPERGTLFLREVADLSLEAQSKLSADLAVARTRALRVIVSTRRSLDSAVERGAFREELVQELAASRIELPPLRERRGDVMLLVEHFCRELQTTSDKLPTKRLAELTRRDWPENVRELRAEVARIAAGQVAVDSRARGAEVPSVDSLGLPLDFRDLVVELSPFAVAKDEVLARFSAAYVTYAVLAHGGHVARAASASGLAPRYFNLLRARTREKSE